ncbi:MAG: hypothetical protein ABJA82_07445 [Myxococcales bacterium]
MKTFGRLKWWLITALLTAPLVALAAGVPKVFTAGAVISSADVNANFTALADRVTALESAVAGKSGPSAVAVVLDGVPGAIPTGGLTGSYTSTGGPLAVIVSGSASFTAASPLDIAVQFDGAVIGHLKEYTNEANSHKAFPTRVFRVAPAAGAHTVGLLPAAGTGTDYNDYFGVTIIELGH